MSLGTYINLIKIDHNLGDEFEYRGEELLNISFISKYKIILAS